MNLFGSSSARTIRREQDALSIPWDLRRRTPLKPDDMVPIECPCPGAVHELHHVEARRLMEGGDLRGKAKVSKVVAALIEEAERGGE